MTKVDRYRDALRSLKDWDSFLLKESGMPGPRPDLELVQAVVEEGNERIFRRYLSFDPAKAPTNSPQVFLAVCGVVGLGKLLSHGKKGVLGTLSRFASDPRWRIREGVAMALQIWGDKDMDSLLKETEKWSAGNFLEKRAAAAALCAPRLLHEPGYVKRVLSILDRITRSLPGVKDRRNEDFKVLRQALGYSWSVAVSAYPAQGKKMMEKWFTSGDKDIHWIMRENLKKNRLARMDKKWVQNWQAQLEAVESPHR